MSTTHALPTIEEARARYARANEDFRAGRIDTDAIGREFNLWEATAEELSAAVVVEGCPAWCTDHEFVYGDTAEQDVSTHSRNIKGNGWSVGVSEIEREPGKYELMTWLDGPCDSLPLEEAPAYAAAIIATVDTVTGANR